MELYETIVTIILVYFAGVNVVTFIVYGIDKGRAEHDRYRIRESTLIGLAAVGGALGAVIGMLVFRHKTRKPKFFILVPLLLIVWAALAVLVILKTKGISGI